MTVKIFDRNMAMLEKAMELRSKRNSMIAANIANRETPGYRAQDLVFEKALDTALYSNKPGDLKVSDPRHFDGRQEIPIEDVSGTQINSHNPDPRMDGNTVNLDKEMAKLAENQLMYQAAARSVNWKFRLLKSAIMEGGR
jgi:flagellar basal-body rod protein FlgB